MSPPTNKPRLRLLDPKVIALEVAQKLLEHFNLLGPYLMPISIDMEPSPYDDKTLLRTHIALTVQDLTIYAQTGNTADWEYSNEAMDGIYSVCRAMWSHAADTDFGVGELLGNLDVETPIGLILVATEARLGIMQGSPVTPRQIATLSDLSTTQVRKLIRDGVLNAPNGMVPAADARKWLVSRDVPGFTLAP